MKMFCAALILALSVNFVVPAENVELPLTRTVRTVYLVSKDSPVRDDFKAAIAGAIVDIQQWYSRQLNGPTFKVHSPVVEVAHSAQNAEWFYGNPNGKNRDDWGFNNTLAEASRLLGARYKDTNYIWIIYSDGPGNKGRGGSGVACLPEDDLLGLIGKHPSQKEVKRWVAGLGHELGHAFGLAHPKDKLKDANAIMWAGIYGKYPDKCYLTAEDKERLLKSPFFFNTNGQPVLEMASPPLN